MPGGQLVEDIRRFLRGTLALQDEMSVLYRRKRIAMTEARAAELLQIADTETRLAKQLQVKLAERRQLLRESAEAGYPGNTVQEVVSALGGEIRAELEPQVTRARQVADDVRRETWIHWIIAQRTLGHYRDLLDLVAQCGRTSPTYSRRPGQEISGGGAILDASA